MSKTSSSNARDIALDILIRVRKTASYANILLPKKLEASDLTAVDRGLATELTYGTLRNLGTINWALAQFSTRPLGELPAEALDILRLAAYQIIYLDRVPARAAIFEAVEQTKRRLHEGLAKYVNAVLRNLDRGQDKLEWPSKSEGLAKYLSLRYSHPEWLADMWVRELGVFEAEALLKADNETPDVSLRANTRKTSPAELIELLAKRGIEAKPGRYLPEALRVTAGGDLTKLQEFKRGLFTIQDEGSMIVSRVVDPRKGETVVDLAAGPGGKATHLSELMGGEGQVIAVDVSEARVKLIDKAVHRLELANIPTVEGDATKLTVGIKHRIDRILVDAPCTGLGSLRRRPDARWRKKPEQIAELAALQQKMLANAARQLPKGGILVYSVCTVSKKETEDVVSKFLSDHRDFEPDRLSTLLPKVLRKEADGTIQLLPSRHGVDGMFIARLRRRDQRRA